MGRPVPGEGREFIAELKRLADPDDFPKILNACRGKRVHLARGDVKASPTRLNWLSRAIGHKKAEALIQKFRTESWLYGDIEVPIDNAGYFSEHRRKRDEAFHAAISAGKTSNEIADLLGISRRAVNLRKKRLRELQERQAATSMVSENMTETDE